jgi:hypothetical protein
MNMSHDDLVRVLVGYISQLPKENAVGQVYATLHAATDALQLVADPTPLDETDDRHVACYAASPMDEVMDEVQTFVEGP